MDVAPSDSIAAYFSTPHCSSLGSPSRSCLRSLWKVFPVFSTVALPDGSTACTTSSTPTVSSLRARSRSPCRMKKPLVLLRPRGDVSSAVTGAPPGSLSARCVVFTVSPCLIIFPPFFCPLIIDPAGRAVPAGPIGGVLCRLDGGILVGTSPATPVDTASGMGIAGDESTMGTMDLSALGESFGHTPLVVPVRGHSDSIKRLLRGDVYIGRGSRQRSLAQEPVLQHVQSLTGWPIGRDLEFSGSVAY